MTTERKTSPWPYAIVGSFLAVIVLNIYMISVALDSDRGTVSNRPYEEGLAFEQELALRRAAQDSKIEPTLQRGSTGWELVLSVPAGYAMPKEVTGELSFMRPSDAALDKRITLQPITESRFALPGLTLEAGMWSVTIELTVAGKRMQFKRALVV